MSQTAPLNADLHCHSIVSDGTLSPEELAIRAHQNGVQLWSLTDHDVLGGQARARLAADNLGMRYLAGVEISISWMNQTVHIVGLGVDDRNTILEEGLLRYLIGFRQKGEFHEHCVEKIFMDIKEKCRPSKLSVYARYTRRGGIDINPFRADYNAEWPDNVRHSRQ